MPYAALSEILAASRFDAPGEPAIIGADPVVPTRYRMGTAGAASLAALGIAVTHLWAQRGGRCQRVAVDMRAAGASLRSSRYFQIDGKPVSVWDPMSGYYPVRDGWISIHCNFPQHRAAAMRVLQSEEVREKAESKSAAWNGEALEDAIHAAGGCAGFVRSAERWAEHAQARAIARQPIVEVDRNGEAPPEPLPRAERPLAGVRVLDLTRVLAGPTCAKSLAEHGADVLKISASHLADMGRIELDTGLGKLSARLDLREEAGLAKLKALVKSGDVFSQSYRPGALGARGFSPPALAALRPGIVYVSLSAWGASGPWRERRGFDSIVQSVSGMAHASGADAGGDKPKLQPVSAIDYVSGYLMAFGAAVALERRARIGGSWLVKVSLARVGHWIVERGLVPHAEWRGLPEELPAAELAPLLAEIDSPLGRVRYLKPVLQLAETPPYWSRPPVPLGTHAPEWPERESR
jgi:crotonobetainyl-CoA:carnitine CoA-transferase CaiB-like acyl-CoA transferase